MLSDFDTMMRYAPDAPQVKYQIAVCTVMVVLVILFSFPFVANIPEVSGVGLAT